MPALRLVRIHERVRLSQLRRRLVPAGPGKRPSSVAVRLDQDRTAARRRRPFHADPGAPDEHDDRRRRALALVIAGLVVVASATWFVRGHGTDPAPASSVPRSGTIVYAVDDGPGWSRLWRWNLESGRVRPGPRVREPTALVNASGAAPGLLGITSMTPDGAPRGPSCGSWPQRLARCRLVQGDLVTWGGRGIAVVAVKRGPISAGCRRITIVTRTVIPPSSERQFSERVCGDILSVGRDATVDVLHDVGRRGRRHPPGELRPDPARSSPGHALLSLSPASDMLVVPSRDLAALRLAPLAVRADDGPPVSSVFGTSLYFRGLSPSADLSAGPDGHLWIDRVLSWANDSTSALVVGSYQDRAGLYRDRGRPQPRAAGPAVPGTDPRGDVGDVRGRRECLRASEGAIALVSASGMVPLPLPRAPPGPTARSCGCP